MSAKGFGGDMRPHGKEESVEKACKAREGERGGTNWNLRYCISSTTF